MRKFLATFGLLLTLNFFVAPLAYAAAYAGIDNFDSYGNGDLNGLNSGSGWATAWSGSVNYDVQAATTFNSSTKAVQVTGGGAENDISRTFTGVDSGDFYWAMRTNSTATNADYCGIEIWNGGTFGGVLGQLNQGDGTLRTYDGSFHTLTSFSADTWYIINVNFVSSTQFKVRWKVSGGTFSAFTSPMTYTSSVTSPDKINLACLDVNSTVDYFDEFGTSDPDPVAPVAGGASSIIGLVQAYWIV